MCVAGRGWERGEWTWAGSMHWHCPALEPKALQGEHCGPRRAGHSWWSCPAPCWFPGCPGSTCLPTHWTWPMFAFKPAQLQGTKGSPVFLAPWLQARVIKSHNIMILNVRPALCLLFNHSRIILNPILKKGMFPVKKTLPTELTWKTFLLEPDKLRTYFLSHTNCRAIKIWDISWELGYLACVFSADCRHTLCPCTCVTARLNQAPKTQSGWQKWFWGKGEVRKWNHSAT